VTLLRKILLVAVLVLLVLIAAVFAYNNPDPVSLDIGLARFDDISLTLVMACAFAVGWLFGLASAGYALMRMAAEKRRIRRELRNVETEVASLRSLPLNDAN
jgi:putative membrane protein